MRGITSFVADAKASARDAVLVSDDFAVLVRARAPGHDEGFVASSRLARTFTEELRRVANSEVLGAAATAALARRILGQSTWLGWHVGFCVVQQAGSVVRALNCGDTGLLRVGSGRIERILAPHTVARRLRADGVTDVPMLAEGVVSSAASDQCTAEDIEAAEFVVSAQTTLVAVTNPSVFDRLTRLIPMPSSDPRELVQRATQNLQNADWRFVALHF